MKRTAWLAVAGLLVAPAGAIAQDQTRTQDRGTVPQHDLTPDQDRIRLQLHDRLVADGSATEAELAALDPEIAAWAKAKGDPEELRKAAREMAGAGCKGACLKETFRAMNTEMNRGATSTQARERAVAAVREQSRAGGGEPKGGASKEAAAREQERDRTQERTRERTQDRTHSHEAAGKGGGPR